MHNSCTNEASTQGLGKYKRATKKKKEILYIRTCGALVQFSCYQHSKSCMNVKTPSMLAKLQTTVYIPSILSPLATAVTVENIVEPRI